MNLRSAACCILVVLFTAPLHAGYVTLETADLRLIYRDVVHSSLAPYTGRCFENAMGFYRKFLGYAPYEKVTVLLDDAYDFNNAAAFASPRNTLLVQIAPASFVYETLPGNERINHTLNHELAHIVALDATAGRDRTMRQVFLGKVSSTREHPESILYEYLTSPRFAATRWFHEGFAVFLETWMAGGIGRAQNSWDEMVFRAMVRDSSRFYDPIGLESEGTKVDFQVGAKSYLYGTRFLTWMALEHGPEKLLQWAVRAPGSKAYFAAQFERTFDLSLEDAWQRWIEWEKGFQQSNLASLRTFPLTPYCDVSPVALGSVSRAFLDPSTQRLYAGMRPPGVLGQVASIALADGAVQDLCEVKGPALYYVTSLAYDPEGGQLYYTGDNNEWRDLWVVDVRTGSTHRMLRDARIGDLVFDRTDRMLWGVRHFNGISTLVRIPPPYTYWNQVYSWPYGQDAYDLDISPDGRGLTFSLSEVSGRQSLQLAAMDSVRTGRMASRELHEFPGSVPANFVFAPDGRFLYGSSYYTGVSNIYRYDFERGTMQAMSNSDTGFFRPLPLGGDSLIVFRYTGEGFVPARIEAKPIEDLAAITLLGQQVAEKYPIVERWNVGSPAKIQIDSLTHYAGPYRNLRSIGLESIYPIVEGYKNSGAVGLCAKLSDPGFWNAIDLTATYSPATELSSDERLHVSFGWRHRYWNARFKHNDADFYDLFGPTKVSRKGYSLGLQYGRRLLDDNPRHLDLTITSTGYTGLEQVPSTQTVAARFDQLWSSQAEIEYSNTRRSLGAVDDEKGIAWHGIATLQVFNRRAIPTFEGGVDFGMPLAMRHTSLWLRSAAGYSTGPRDEPFSNFYFGSFGNNKVDYRSEKRYRDTESFPGLEIGEVGGSNFVKSTLELNLPPIRFRRIGVQSFYVTWARTAVFAGGVATNVDRAGSHREVIDLGVQIDLRFTLLSRLGMTLSSGWATGFEQSRRAHDEWMISLKVL